MRSFNRWLDEFAIEKPKAKETLGIDRDDMPQVDGKDMPALTTFLKQQGIRISKLNMNPEKLKPIQRHFDNKKVERAIDFLIKEKDNPKPIMVSADNYIMDGHHRWLAYKNLKRSIPTVKASANRAALMKAMHEFPKSYTKRLRQ